MINIFIVSDSSINNNSTNYISNDIVKFTIFGSIAFAAFSVKMLKPEKNVEIVLLDTKKDVNKFLKACCFMGINYSKLTIATTDNGNFQKWNNQNSKNYVDLKNEELILLYQLV